VPAPLGIIQETWEWRWRLLGHTWVTLYETLGPDWLTPDLYRLGASSLLNDILMQIRKERTGRYQSADYFTVD